MSKQSEETIIEETLNDRGMWRGDRGGGGFPLTGRTQRRGGGENRNRAR